MEKMMPACAQCSVKDKMCVKQEGSGPDFCPTKTQDKIVQSALKKYQDPEILRFAHAASVQEAECYVRREEKPFVLRPTKTRVEEVMEFAQRMGYRKLGVAFCNGLAREAGTFARILEQNGFEVVSVNCKVGRVEKEFLGLKDAQKVKVGCPESMCNPISQAEILNEAGTEFNVLLGLCVGHDSLFLKNAKAFTTVLVVKDRVLGHNSVAALYGAHSYFQRLMVPDKKS